MKIVYRPTARMLTVLCDKEHKMDLETVSLKDLFGSSSIIADLPATYWHFAIGRNLALVKPSLSIL